MFRVLRTIAIGVILAAVAFTPSSSLAQSQATTGVIEGIVTDVNKGAQALLGWTPEELIGRHYHLVLTPAAQGLAEERTRRYLAGEDMSSIFDLDLVRKDGTIVPVEARTRAVEQLRVRRPQRLPGLRPAGLSQQRAFVRQ